MTIRVGSMEVNALIRDASLNGVDVSGGGATYGLPSWGVGQAVGFYGDATLSFWLVKPISPMEFWKNQVYSEILVATGLSREDLEELYQAESANESETLTVMQF